MRRAGVADPRSRRGPAGVPICTCRTCRTAMASSWPVLLEALPYRKDDLTRLVLRRIPPAVRRGRFARVPRRPARDRGVARVARPDEYPPRSSRRPRRGDRLAGGAAVVERQRRHVRHVVLRASTRCSSRAEQPAGSRRDRARSTRRTTATPTTSTTWAARCEAVDLVDYCHYMTAMNALPPVPALFGDGWRDEWLARARRAEPWVLRWLEEQRDGPYWRHGSAATRLRAHRVPDDDRRRLGRRLPQQHVPHLRAPAVPEGAADRAVEPQSPATSLPGPHIDLVPEMIRWFDRWLRDVDTGVDRATADPGLRAPLDASPSPTWPSIAGEWRSDAAWPPADSRHEHVLRRRAPARTRSTSSPSAPTSARPRGTPAPAGCRGASRSTSATTRPGRCPTTGPIDEGRAADPRPSGGHRCASPPTCRSRPSSVKLCDVFPDGTSQLVTRGFLNLAHRHSSLAAGSRSCPASR